MKNNCSHLYLLSALVCQLTECFNEQELETLSADLTTLGYMIESTLSHRCRDHCGISDSE